MFRIAAMLAAIAVPSALAAADWKQVDMLPGDIAVDLDQQSVTTGLDGETTVTHATFRRHMPTQIMESDIAMDCTAQTAKLRGLRLIYEDGNSHAMAVPLTSDYHQVSFGSADAIYFKALCGREIPPPEGYASEEDPVLEDPNPGDNPHPLTENPVLEDETPE